MLYGVVLATPSSMTHWNSLSWLPLPFGRTHILLPRPSPHMICHMQFCCAGKKKNLSHAVMYLDVRGTSGGVTHSGKWCKVVFHPHVAKWAHYWCSRVTGWSTLSSPGNSSWECATPPDIHLTSRYTTSSYEAFPAAIIASCEHYGEKAWVRG